MSDDIFSSHHENADFFNSVTTAIKKGFFLRRWAKLSNLKLKPHKSSVKK